MYKSSYVQINSMCKPTYPPFPTVVCARPPVCTSPPGVCTGHAYVQPIPSNFRMCKSCYVHSHRYVQTRMSMHMPAHPPSPAVQHVQIVEYVQVVQYVHMYMSASCMCVPTHPPHAPFQNAPSRPTCGNTACKSPALYMSATRMYRPA